MKKIISYIIIIMLAGVLVFAGCFYLIEKKIPLKWVSKQINETPEIFQAGSLLMRELNDIPDIITYDYQEKEASDYSYELKVKTKYTITITKTSANGNIEINSKKTSESGNVKTFNETYKVNAGKYYYIEGKTTKQLSESEWLEKVNQIYSNLPLSKSETKNNKLLDVDIVKENTKKVLQKGNLIKIYAEKNNITVEVKRDLQSNKIYGYSRQENIYVNDNLKGSVTMKVSFEYKK